MSFHGIDNQGRKYYNPSFAIRKYKHLRLAFQTIETMVENRNRLNLWIRRNSVDIVSQSV
ncbi:MAG: hypothetical protein GWN62_24345 [Aliifodinibius sp.]|nr:hypothetical protein [Fodinibius sp.]